MVNVALTIASSDSSCGAGVSNDLLVFNKFGVYGTMAIATVTAQNSFGVNKIFKVAPRVIEAQIDSVVKDFNVVSCKVGMLYSHEIVNAVSTRIKRRNIKNVVLDIPIISKNGRQITTDKAYKTIVRNLIPLSFIITPNKDEAERLCGFSLDNKDLCKDACKYIFNMGVKNVLLKGGHLDMPVDLLYDGSSFYEFSGEKYADKHMHGTGCALSAAICANLANGIDIVTSVGNSKNFLNDIIKTSVRLGKSNMDFMI